MKTQTFILVLIISVVLSYLFYFITDFFIDISAYHPFLLICISFFLLFTSIIFISAKYIVGKNKKNSFLSIVILNVFLKLVISFGLVYWYVNQFEPQDKWFILPFLICYLVFTVAETYILTKIAQV